MSSTAARLLSASGERVEITFDVGLDYDPVTGDTVAGSADQTVYGNAYPSSYLQQHVDGKDILASDIRLVLEPISRPPEVGCKVVISGMSTKVISVKSITKSGNPMLYICQLRAS
jgi:hypothetical protein